MSCQDFRGYEYEFGVGCVVLPVAFGEGIFESVRESDLVVDDLERDLLALRISGSSGDELSWRNGMKIAGR